MTPWWEALLAARSSASRGSKRTGTDWERQRSMISWMRGPAAPFAMTTLSSGRWARRASRTGFTPAVTWFTGDLQAEGDDVVAERGEIRDAVSAGGDDEILFAVGAEEGHGCGFAAGGERAFPEQLAGFGVEGVNGWVDGAGDEGEAAGGGDGSAEGDGAEVGGQARRELTERDFPFFFT